MLASTPKDYQVLLDHPRGAGMVVSCYADTSVADGFEPHWRQRLKAEATRIRGLLAGEPAALGEFERQLESIRRALESDEARHARGMAVFAVAGWDEVVAIPSDEPFEGRVVVDEVPYVLPLLVAEYRRREYLAVMTDTHRGRLYAAAPGAERLLDELDESGPKKDGSSGQRREEQQADTARHREDQLLHYQKELAEHIERAWAAGHYQGIILLGEHEVLENLRRHLPKRLAERVVHEAPHSWTGRQPEIHEQVRGVVDAAIAGCRERLMEEIGRRIGEGYAVAVGPQEVIATLANNQVVELVMGPDPGEVASLCTGCGSLFAAEESACPYCKAPCARASLWQEIASRAARQGVAVHFVPADAGPAVPGGVAALLARDEPPWSPASTASETTGRET
jgi:protein required for attachment to host cells